MDASTGKRRSRHRVRAAAIGLLMLVTAVAFALASLIHFGVTLIAGPVRLDDPFRGAAIPEAVIAAVLVLDAVAALARRSYAWWAALAATLFSLLVTLYGLSVTLGSGRTGDVRYHLAVLASLAVIAGLLLLPGGRRSVGSGDENPCQSAA